MATPSLAAIECAAELVASASVLTSEGAKARSPNSHLDAQRLLEALLPAGPA